MPQDPGKRQKALERKAAKRKEKAIAYARELGFSPDRDYHDAKFVLGDADPDASPVPIRLGGPEGKPFYVAGPHDDARAIMAKLTRKLGPDGFKYLIPVSPFADALSDEDGDQEEEDDEEGDDAEK
jgi:hypothetical protein